LKKIVAYVVAVLLILLGLALALPGMIDWNQYKPMLVEAIDTATGHKVQIGGQVSLQIVPHPALVAEDVALLAPAQEGDAEAQVFLSMRRFSANLAFFPLLTGRTEVSSLGIGGLNLDLRRFADGSANWDFLVKPGAGAGDAEDLQLHSVEVTDSRIHLIDAVSGRDDLIEDLNAEFSARTAVGPYRAEGSFMRAGYDFQFMLNTGRIETARSFPATIRLGTKNQTTKNQSAEFQGTVVIDGAASAASGNMEASGSDLGQFLEAVLSLVGVEPPTGINLSKTFEVKTPLVLTRARMTARPFEARLNGTGATGELIYVPDQGGRVELKADLNTLKLDEWLVSSSADQNGASTGFNTEMGVKLDVKLGALEYRRGVARQLSLIGELDKGAGRVGRLSGVFPGGSELALRGDIDLSGKVPSFKGPAQLTSDNLRTLLDWLGVGTSDIAEGRLAAFSFEGDLVYSADEVAARDIRGQLDSTLFRGTLARVGLTSAPRWDVDVAVSRLDMDRYFPAPDTPMTSLSELLSAPLAELAGNQGSFKLNADELSGRGVDAKELRVFLRVADGDLRIHRLRAASIAGLGIDIEGAVNQLAGAPQMAVNAEVKADNLAAFYRWLGSEPSVDVFKLGQFSYTGHFGGTLDAPTLKGSGQLAGAGYRLEGMPGYLTGGDGEYRFDVSAQHPNHRDLLRTLEVGLELSGAGEPVDMAGVVTGSKARVVFAGTLGALGGQAAIDGEMNLVEKLKPFDVRLSVNHAAFPKLVKVFNWNLNPVSNIGGVDMIARATGQQNKYDLDVQELAIGSTQMSGAISVDQTGARPNLTGQIVFADVAVHDFVPPDPAGADAAKRAGGKRWSTANFDLSLARAWDVSLDISAKALAYQTWRYTAPKFLLALKSGQLKISQFTGALFGGRVTGALDVDLSGTPKGTMHLAMEDTQIDQLLEASAAIKPVTGLLGMSIETSFQGDSQYALVSTLAGRVELWARNGLIRGLDVPRLAGRMGRLQRLPDFVGLVGSALSGGQTPYGNIRTILTGEKGVFSTRRIDADIAGADVRGRMDIRLPPWTLTASGQLQLKPGDEIDSASLPPIGVDIDGDIDDPVIYYRTERLKTHMAGVFSKALLEQVSGQGTALDVLTGVLPNPLATQPDVQLDENGQPIPVQTEPTPSIPEASATTNPGAAVMQGIFSLIRQARPKPEEPPKDPDNNN